MRTREGVSAQGLGGGQSDTHMENRRTGGIATGERGRGEGEEGAIDSRRLCSVAGDYLRRGEQV